MSLSAGRMTIMSKRRVPKRLQFLTGLFQSAEFGAIR
jgi:hypothetical protein